MKLSFIIYIIKVIVWWFVLLFIVGQISPYPQHWGIVLLITLVISLIMGFDLSDFEY